MPEWGWVDEYGRFQVRVFGEDVFFECHPTALGEREMGFVAFDGRRTLAQLDGLVPVDILTAVTRALAEARESNAGARPLVRGARVAWGERRLRSPSFAPDSARFAAACDAFEVALFDAHDGGFRVIASAPAGISRFPYARRRIEKVAWSPCGRFIATLEDDRAALRRAADLAEIASYEALGALDLAFGGDGEWLALSAGATLTVHRTPDLRVRSTYHLDPNDWAYFRMKLGAVGTIVVVADDGGENDSEFNARRGTPMLTVVDVDEGRVVARSRMHVARVVADRWRDRVILECTDHAAIVSARGEVVRRFAGYAREIGACAAAKPFLATSGGLSDRRLDLWDPEGLTLLATTGLARSSESLAVSPDGGVVLVADEDDLRARALRIWSAP